MWFGFREIILEVPAKLMRMHGSCTCCVADDINGHVMIEAD